MTKNRHPCSLFAGLHLDFEKSELFLKAVHDIFLEAMRNRRRIHSRTCDIVHGARVDLIVVEVER
ncbi:hypothetical protein [Rhizobium sp. MHM7A]|uniref:hypothetical protein n=1 Tax=Rhizobium sp. MHM7A TaxID=2583233 RepID=UPI00148727CD|nr:hypothetical protein [Rhizobium sp. MHM7A]